MDKSISSFLEFKKIHDTGKTFIWLVRTSSSLTPLGQIRWYNAWRRYCFYPIEDTLFDANCLCAIANFMDKRMGER